MAQPTHRTPDCIEIPAPAKVNLYLAVTGRRPDGYHELVSIAAPLEWGDRLSVRRVEPGPGRDEGLATLRCDLPGLPTDASNLVLAADRAFREETDLAPPVAYALSKRIPTGAGLGGGSSDAVAALVALNEMSGSALAEGELLALAAGIGSDCPLFLAGGPVVVRGRGERIEPLAPAAASRLAGRRILVFKAGFGVPTPWAYRHLAAGAPGTYVPAAEAEAAVASWIADESRGPDDLGFNSFEGVVFGKFAAMRPLVDELNAGFGLRVRMSGSGSACYAFLDERLDSAPIEAAIRAAWGAGALVVDTRIARAAPRSKSN